MLDKVREIIAENLGIDPESITEDTELIEDLGADSLDAIELTMAVEDEYGIEIEDEVLAELITVGDILEAIEERLM